MCKNLDYFHHLLLTILILIIPIFCSAQIFMIGQTMSKIRSHFNYNLPNYQFEGIQRDKDGLKYMEFKNTSEYSINHYYFEGKDSICKRVWIVQELSSMSKVIVKMNEKCKVISELNWKDNNKQIFYRLVPNYDKGIFELMGMSDDYHGFDNQISPSKEFWNSRNINFIKQMILNSENIEILNPEYREAYIDCVMITLKKTYPNGFNRNLSQEDEGKMNKIFTNCIEKVLKAKKI